MSTFKAGTVNVWSTVPEFLTLTTRPVPAWSFTTVGRKLKSAASSSRTGVRPLMTGTDALPRLFTLPVNVTFGAPDDAHAPAAPVSTTDAASATSPALHDLPALPTSPPPDVSIARPPG